MFLMYSLSNTVGSDSYFRHSTISNAYFECITVNTVTDTILFVCVAVFVHFQSRSHCTSDTTTGGGDSQTFLLTSHFVTSSPTIHIRFFYM